MILPYIQQAYSSTRNLTCFQQSYKSSRYQQKLTLLHQTYKMIKQKLTFFSRSLSSQPDTHFFSRSLISSLSFQQAFTVIISFFNKLHISQPKMQYTIKSETHLFSIYSQTLQFQSSHFQQAHQHACHLILTSNIVLPETHLIFNR